MRKSAAGDNEVQRPKRYRKLIVPGAAGVLAAVELSSSLWDIGRAPGVLLDWLKLVTVAAMASAHTPSTRRITHAGAFLYYGQLMGDIVKYQAEDGSKLEREWFLQVLEAAANVLVGLAGLILTQGGPSPSIPYKSFLLTGSTQVLAKAMTQKAQIYGVPFFLATLVKNAKMVPVMVGAIVLSGTRYPARKWAQVALIIGGVVLVTVGKARKPGASDGHADVIGMACLGLSLVCDGTTRCANQISRLTRDGV